MGELSMEDFLLARIKECENYIYDTFVEEHLALRSRLLGMLEAQRKLVEWHASFPVLVQGKPEIKHAISGSDIDYNAFSLQFSKQIDLWTRDQYKRITGTWPPALKLMQNWVKQYEKHPQFDKEWLA